MPSGVCVMLTAIVRGKTRKLSKALSAGDSLRGVFIRSEDLFTATVFERLAYLDGSLLWSIIEATFKPFILPSQRFAELVDIEFWPMWSHARGILKKSVEPDVVLRFLVGDPAQSVTLILECKLDGPQYPEQWMREWIAHREECGANPPDECWLLALGGLAGKPEDVVASFTGSIKSLHAVSIKALAADWQDLLHALNNVKVESPSSRRIISDIQEALALHGYRFIRPMSDLIKIAMDLGIRFEHAVHDLKPWKRLSQSTIPPGVDTKLPVRSALFQAIKTKPDIFRWDKN